MNSFYSHVQKFTVSKIVKLRIWIKKLKNFCLNNCIDWPHKASEQWLYATKLLKDRFQEVDQYLNLFKNKNLKVVQDQLSNR